MATNARTLYLDSETYRNLGLLAGLKRTSRSSVIRSMINEEFRLTKQRHQLEEQSAKQVDPEGIVLRP